jgi:hypothetical protein
MYAQIERDGQNYTSPLVQKSVWSGIVWGAWSGCWNDVLPTGRYKCQKPLKSMNAISITFKVEKWEPTFSALIPPNCSLVTYFAVNGANAPSTPIMSKTNIHNILLVMVIPLSWGFFTSKKAYPLGKLYSTWRRYSFRTSPHSTLSIGHFSPYCDKMNTDLLLKNRSLTAPP